MKGIEQAYRQHVLICQTAVKSYGSKEASVCMSITVTSSPLAVCLAPVITTLLEIFLPTELRSYPNPNALGTFSLYQC